MSKRDMITRGEAIAMFGEMTVTKLDGSNCEPTCRLRDDTETGWVEFRAAIKIESVDYSQLMLYFDVPQEDLGDEDDNLDWCAYVVGYRAE